MTAAAKLSSLLVQLKQQMQEAKLWESLPPSDQALASVEPFAIDTLQPEQWLQWVFIQKLSEMLKANQPLPKGFSISPYFDEVWKLEPAMSDILKTLNLIDEVCA